MKRFVRCVSLLLAFSLMLAIPARAADTAETRASDFFMGSSVYLCNVSGTSFEAWFSVTAVRGMDVIGAKTIKIQRSSDGSNWTTVKTFSMDTYSGMVDYDTVTHATGVSYTGNGGYYYRAYYKLYAKDETGSGVWNRYSSSLYIG